MFPSTYLDSLYRHLRTQRVEFLTHEQLCFDFDREIRTEEELKEFFAEEWQTFRKERLSKELFHLLILHDSDSGPRETEKVCELEAELGLTSTTSVFASGFKNGEIEPYPIDYAKLARLQDEAGICFSYHCDALVQGGFDIEKAAEIFEKDIRFLESQGLQIRCFSPHGGVRGPNGEVNNSVFRLAHTDRRLIWTHNRFAPAGARYSDGALANRLVKADPRLDLRQFLVERCKTGARGFMLLHPQYYYETDASKAEPFFGDNPWLREIWEHHDAGKMAEYWKPVQI